MENVNVIYSTRIMDEMEKALENIGIKRDVMESIFLFSQKKGDKVDEKIFRCYIKMQLEWNRQRVRRIMLAKKYFKNNF